MNTPKDVTLLEAALHLDELMKKGCTFYQKFTCSNCGSRQTMEKKNLLYTSGKCEECGSITIIERCGYMVDGPPDVIIDDLLERKIAK
jgi:hypothetical protein